MILWAELSEMKRRLESLITAGSHKCRLDGTEEQQCLRHGPQGGAPNLPDAFCLALHAHYIEY